MNNEAQIEYWNGQAGDKWVRNAKALDGMLTPFIDAILGEAKLMAGETVLDIGCGAGALSLAAQEQVQPKGTVTGIDISRPLLDLAGERAEASGSSARFEEADASAYSAEKPVDCAISRFGVMFFDDPVGAFRSLRASLRPEGRLVFACWRGLAENEWARLPLETAQHLLKEIPASPPPGAPGPFAFADGERVRTMLKDAGWRGVDVKRWSGEMTMPGASIKETAEFMLELGPLSRLIAEAEVDKGALLDRLQSVLSDRADASGQVTLTAEAWIVSATAS